MIFPNPLLKFQKSFFGCFLPFLAKTAGGNIWGIGLIDKNPVYKGFFQKPLPQFSKNYVLGLFEPFPGQKPPLRGTNIWQKFAGGTGDFLA